MSKNPVADFATDFDHTDQTWVADPYPIMEDLRDRCPVAHSDRYGGMWVPMLHSDVAAIANDTEHFTSRSVVVTNSRPGPDAPPAPIGLAPPISSDPPFHALARHLLLPAFAPKTVNALEGFSRDLCTTLLDDMGDRAVVDAATQYAQYIPVAVIAKMVGLPPEDGDLFRGFVHAVMESVDYPLEERLAMIDPMRIYLEGVVADHRANPRDDLTTFLLNAEIAGNPLEDTHVVGTMILLVIAGIDTTWSAIGSSLWHLAQNPDDLARLVADPSALSMAIEEFLRAYAPVTMARLVKEDFEFEGCPMQKDDWILLSFPAANRDPAFFDRADEVLIDRAENRHAAFGLGIHRCLGSNLARLEMKVAIEEFIARFPRFELADPDEVTFSQGQVRGPRSLPIRILERA
jgi:cytochrome P450